MNFPLINACLNSLSAVLLVLGWIIIRQGNIKLHKKVMLSALATSAIFLGFYLYYHVTTAQLHFNGTGTQRLVYFIILIPHVILAAVMVPMILRTFFLGFKAEHEEAGGVYRQKHLKLAKKTLPIWLYVSVTGVILYFYIYVWFPGKMTPREHKLSNQSQTEEVQ